MSRHHLRNKGSPEQRKSVKGILLRLELKNRNRAFSAQVEDLQQKLAGFGLPPPRVIEAFRNGTAAETAKFKTDGKRLLFNGYEVARHKPGGMEVSYQGYNTSMTAATLRALGVDTRRTRGITTINGKGVDPESTDYHFVPTKNISPGTFRVNPNSTQNTSSKTINEQEIFRKKVRKNLTGDSAKIPLDPTAIQPGDQREINSITGIKSKIPRETKGVDTHHLLPKETFPGLGTNAENGAGLSKKNHTDLHGLNKKLFSTTPVKVDASIEAHFKKRNAKIAGLKLKLAGLPTGPSSSTFPHFNSTFLSPNGDFIGSRDFTERDGSNIIFDHSQLIDELEPKNKNSLRGEDKIMDFMNRTGHVRIHEHSTETNVHANSSINNSQLRQIRKLTKDADDVGKPINFQIGDGRTDEESNDFKSFANQIKSRNKLSKLKQKLAELKAFTNSSSFVGNMRYDSDEQTLTGILSGKHYMWCDVPERKFDSFMGAGSAGAYFNRSLKGQHDCSSGGILSSLKSRISKMKLAIQDVSEPFKRQRLLGDSPHVLHPKSKEIEEHASKLLDVSPGFTGSHFLTTSGELLGNGKTEHRTMSHKILSTFPDEKFKEMADFADSRKMSRWGTDGRNMSKLLEQTGMSRVSADKLGINIDSKHPLTKQQRSVISQHLDDNNIGSDNVFIDDDTPSQNTIRKQLRMARLNNGIDIEDGMAQIAQNLSADGIVDNFVNSKTDVQGTSGVYDPVQNKVLDATRPVDAIRLQKFFNSEHLGFNSVTDTRAGPNTDIELVRTQLRDIENNGGTPALGFDGGSLEALDISFEDSDEGHLGRLLDHQNSTGVLDNELNFRILKNPKYTQ